MESIFDDLARFRQTEVLTNFVSYTSFCAARPSARTMVHQGPSRLEFATSFDTGFRSWLPWSFILASRFYEREIPAAAVQEFMLSGRTFLKFFEFPHRLSLLRPTSVGWFESWSILPRDALELAQLRHRFQDHVRETPGLDRGYDD